MAARMAKAGSEDKPAKKAKAKTGTKKAPARPYERPRGGEPRAIADLVPEIRRAPFRKFGFIHSSVVSRLREFAGHRPAHVTQPAHISLPPGPDTPRPTPP